RHRPRSPPRLRRVGYEDDVRKEGRGHDTLDLPRRSRRQDCARLGWREGGRSRRQGHRGDRDRKERQQGRQTRQTRRARHACQGRRGQEPQGENGPLVTAAAVATLVWVATPASPPDADQRRALTTWARAHGVVLDPPAEGGPPVLAVDASRADR